MAVNNQPWLFKTLLGVAAGLAFVVPASYLLHISRPGALSPAHTATAIVSSVIDGDTLSVIIAGKTERVRLIGIDTPESVSTSTPKQCFGDEASAALEGLVAPGDVVIIASDTERRDRYGRLLLYVHTNDGLFINEWLVSAGFADVLFYEPNTTFRTELTAARNQARAASVGLWGACDGPDQPLS